MFFCSFFNCFCLWMPLSIHEKAYQWLQWNGFGISWLCSTVIACWQQWISELISKSVNVCCTNCWRVHPLTVADSPSEEERSREEKQAGGGGGTGNDLSLPAHENQMFSKTPRHPIFVMHQHPEEAGIPNYSLCIPYSSLELLNQLDLASYLHRWYTSWANSWEIWALWFRYWDLCGSNVHLCETVLMIKPFKDAATAERLSLCPDLVARGENVVGIFVCEVWFKGTKQGHCLSHNDHLSAFFLFDLHLLLFFSSAKGGNPVERGSVWPSRSCSCLSLFPGMCWRLNKLCF